VGGEGRNFQFAHHLVHYDLPWSPATVEQRIGRLDRIGQLRPVEVHVLEPAGTLLAEVAELFASAVGVFGETVGGLDAVLEEVEPRLSELALAEPGERARYAEALQAKVAEARAAVKRAYDPLLDLRSFDRPGVESLVARAHERMGMELDEEGSLEEGLLSVARDLDERLEEATTELARKVGIGVDTDEQVEAFQCAFQFGHALNVEALPGLSIAEDRTVLGTFWRDTATEQEEIEYFATGHPIVEALFGFLKDGPFGRSGARRVASKAHKGRGIEFLFHAIPSAPADTSPGARVPSRQLARFLDRWLIPVVVAEGPGGKPKLEPGWRGALEKEGAPIKGDVLRSAFPTLAGFVDEAAQVAAKGAEEALAVMVARAAEGIVREREASLGRLALALKHQGVAEEAARAQLAAEKGHYGALLEALQKVKVVLDSACVFAFER
jgi:ATP-dependent helicase HepA